MAVISTGQSNSQFTVNLTRSSSYLVMQRLLGLMCVGLLAACSTTQQMVVPQDISAASDVLVVTERSLWTGSMANETFTLGEYKVVDVDRDWDSTHSDTVSINKVDLVSGRTKGAYAYQFKSKDGLLKGKCKAKGSDESVGMSGFKVEKRKFNLNCACSDGSKEVAKVTLQARNMDNFTGKISVHDKSYDVVSLTEVEGSMSMGVSGYRVDGDKPIGAVEVLQPGRVWLAKHLVATEKTALACSFVGLILYLPTE